MDRKRIINGGIVLLNGNNPNGTIRKIAPTKINKPLILPTNLLCVSALSRWGLLIFSKKLSHFISFFKEVRSFSSESVLAFEFIGYPQTFV